METKPKIPKKIPITAKSAAVENDGDNSFYYDLPRDLPIISSNKENKNPIECVEQAKPQNELIQMSKSQVNPSDSSLGISQINLNEENDYDNGNITPVQTPIETDNSYAPLKADKKKPKLPPKTIFKSREAIEPTEECYNYCSLVTDPKKLPQNTESHRRQSPTLDEDTEQDYFTYTDDIILIESELLKMVNENDKVTTVEDFERNLYSIKSAAYCVDCYQAEPKWLSLFYLTTLCDCCVKIHLNFIKAEQNKSKYIKITDCPAASLSLILHLIKHSGNDKLNSLLEYGLDSSSSNGLRKNAIFIYDKYVNLKYIIENDQLNASQLYQIVSGNCLAYTVYNLILGANINFVNFSQNKSVFDNAMASKQYAQAYYLYLNNAKSFVLHLNDVKRLLATHTTDFSSLKLEQYFQTTQKSNLIEFNLSSAKIEIKNFSTILLKSIIRLNLLNGNLIEIKWCLEENQSIISSFIKITNEHEKCFVLKCICKNLLVHKLNGNEAKDEQLNNKKLIELFDTIDSNLFTVHACGILQNNLNENLFTILVKSKYDQHLFKRDLILFNLQTLVVSRIDLRNIDTVSLNDHFELAIKLISTTNYFLFKSIGYSDNLNHWQQILVCFSDLTQILQANPNKIQINYLNTENVPIIIEKFLDFIQLNNINVGKMDKSVEINEGLIQNLRKIKSFSFNLSNNIDHTQILHTFYVYINENLNFKQLFDDLKKLLERNEAKSLKILRNFFQKFHENHLNYIDFCVFKYFLGFILINSVYLFKNLNDLCKFLFDSVYRLDECAVFGEHTDLSVNRTDDLVKFLLRNFLVLFEFNNKTHLSKQIEYLNKCKLAEMLHGNTSNGIMRSHNCYLHTIYLCSSLQKSYQLNISKNFKNCHVIIETIKYFQLKESKYWCLCEVYEETHNGAGGGNELPVNTHLERILPVNASFYDIISRWFNSYYVCVKLNPVQIELDNAEKDDLLLRRDVLSNKCDFYSLTTTPSVAIQQKHKACIICIRNANICIYKNLNCIDLNQTLVTYNIESCLFYIGYVGLTSTATDQQRNYLTVYNIPSKQLICISFQSHLDAYKWYFSLFKQKYFNDLWSYYTSSHLPCPVNTQSLPTSPSSTPKQTVVSSSRRSSDIAKMIFGKIIKK